MRVYLPPDANCLLSVADHCFASRDYVNLIVVDKQPQLQYLDMDAAREHCARGRRGVGVGRHRATATGEPDIVLACAGDVADAGDARGGGAAARVTSRPRVSASSTSST